MSATRADDLAPLLMPPPPPGIGYRRGVLTSYNSTTFASAVDVDGMTLTNLPIIVTAGLGAGQVVAILTVGTAATSWLILGRLTVPA